MNPLKPHILRKGDAPTPFTAAQIREGCPTGRSIITRTETPGQPAVSTTTTFVETDEEGAVMERDDGSRFSVTWADLQGHASFPADRVRIDDDVIETPLGTLQCLRYTVEQDGGFDTFWFALAHPGMPVRHMSERDGEVIATNTVVANSFRN